MLKARADTAKIADLAAYHKAAREYLGVANVEIDALAREWRAALDLDGRLALAAALWDSDVHEARIAAAKLLTQARIRPDDGVWDLILRWLPDLDALAIFEQVMKAGERRLTAEPARLAEVQTWLENPSAWVRRAAISMTQPWTRVRNPKPDDLARTEMILDWLSGLAEDRDWLVQNAIGVWLRDLSKHDPARVRLWLESHGERLKPFARKDAAQRL